MSDFLKQFAGENYQAQDFTPVDESPVVSPEQQQSEEQTMQVAQPADDFQQIEQPEQGQPEHQDIAPMESMYEPLEPIHDEQKPFQEQPFEPLPEILPDLPSDLPLDVQPNAQPEPQELEDPAYYEADSDVNDEMPNTEYDNQLTEPLYTSTLMQEAEAVDTFYQPEQADYPASEPTTVLPELLQPTTSLPAATTHQKIASAAHDVRKDASYDKKKIVRYATIAASVLAACLLIFGIFFLTQQVQVRDFVGSNVTEARTWGIQNRITIDPTEVYNLEHDSGVVISQSREPDTRIRRGSVLRLEVSRGPDMSEIIELPNFEEMTTPEVRQWREEMRALNANINEEFSDDVEAGKFIRYEFTDSAVTRDSYTRADGLLIYMSRGQQTFEANITVPNFFERPLEEVKEWAREQRVELIIEEAAHETVMAGLVAAQSVDPGDRVAQRDEITLTVSLGISVTVPNFNTISFEDANYPGLEVNVQRRYNTGIAFGGLISQSIPAGTELIGEDHSITVVYSLGRPYIDNLVGESESMIAEYFYSFNAGGADITYRIIYVSSHEPRGTIIGMSRFAQFLSLNERIDIRVSRGDLTPPAQPEGEFDSLD